MFSAFEMTKEFTTQVPVICLVLTTWSIAITIDQEFIDRQSELEAMRKLTKVLQFSSICDANPEDGDLVDMYQKNGRK